MKYHPTILVLVLLSLSSVHAAKPKCPTEVLSGLAGEWADPARAFDTLPSELRSFIPVFPAPPIVEFLVFQERAAADALLLRVRQHMPGLVLGPPKPRPYRTAGVAFALLGISTAVATTAWDLPLSHLATVLIFAGGMSLGYDANHKRGASGVNGRPPSQRAIRAEVALHQAFWNSARPGAQRTHWVIPTDSAPFNFYLVTYLGTDSQPRTVVAMAPEF